MAMKGDTIRLEVKFMDFDGLPVEPTDVALTLYSEDNTAIQSFPLTSEHREGVGEYFFDYTIPYSVGDFIIYEFSGIHRTRPILSRDKIPVEFV